MGETQTKQLKISNYSNFRSLILCPFVRLKIFMPLLFLNLIIFLRTLEGVNHLQVHDENVKAQGPKRGGGDELGDMSVTELFV